MRSRFHLIAAVYLVLRKDDSVLLLRRANTGYQDGKYSLVAGHLNGDELATEALKREAKEEAGIDIDTSKLRCVHVAHRLSRPTVDNERIDVFFELTEWSGDIQNIEPHKCDDLSWFDIHDLPGNIIPFVRNVLTDISDGVYYSEYTHEP